jgi:hypothetical protein
VSKRRMKIEQLLRDLKEELMEAILHEEIDENFTDVFVIPYSKSIRPGVVVCKIELKPTTDTLAPSARSPLRVVRND